MYRRTFLGTTTAVMGSFAGCSKFLPPKTTDSDSLVESGSKNHPHEIQIDNSLDHDVIIIITVKRGNVKVYQEKHTVTAQTRSTVAGITEAELAGNDQSVTVIAEDATGQSTVVTTSVSNCLGNIIFFYDSDGKLESTYSIC